MNNFNKVCPSGNHMLHEPRKVKDPDDYPPEQEEQDMEDYYDEKYGEEERC